MAKQRGLGKGLDSIFGPGAKKGKTYKTVAESVAEKNSAEKGNAEKNGTVSQSGAAAAATEAAGRNPSAEETAAGETSGFSSGAVEAAEPKAETPAADSIVTTLKISMIQPNSGQPRKDFDEEKLNELAESIREYGIIQPLVVKKQGPLYEIIAGERRWRAARLAGLKEVPAIIRELDAETGTMLSIVENIQRADLNAVEEALAYQSLIDAYGLTQEQVAEKVAKKRSTVTNSLRILRLEPEYLDMLKNGRISAGHARSLLAIEDPELRHKVAERCAKENLSVREIETIVKMDRLAREKKEKQNSPEAAELKKRKVIYKDLEKRMRSRLGTKVSIQPKDLNRGTVEIEYYSQEDLDRLFLLLNSVQGN